MAGVICQSCQTQNAADETLCGVCGYLLAEEGGGEGPQDPREQERTCPACGAAVPNTTNVECVNCLEPLTPTEIKLRLTFGDHEVKVPTPGLLLGRDPADSPVANLFAEYDNISRKHATVGVEAGGRAWVRDEDSTNGTFVNDKRVPSGRRTPLLHGDQLRMGSNVTAKVELR